MNILLITTFFQPDSEIAAVRPYKFAKYLSKAGHNVTVLRSGKIYSKPIQGFHQDDEQFRVISFYGDDSDAELYRRGEYVEKAIKKTHSNIPGIIRRRLSGVYHFLKEPFEAQKNIKQSKKDFELQKLKLDEMKREGEQFDLVFSTFSKLENIFAGEYAAKLFAAKWIMDFRDPVVQKNGGINYSWNIRTKNIQLHALQTASLSTTVSDGLTRELQRYCPEAKVATLYNGYDYEDALLDKAYTKSGPLVICYTGMVYRYRQEALEGFLDCLSEVLIDKRVEEKNIKFVYAGPNSEIVKMVFSERNMLGILDDRGYISREEAQRIQDYADIFLVLSWNTKTSQGVLTGKFYEGIRAKKPIVSVVAGKLPGSELNSINEKYQYGYCFELCKRKSQLLELKDYFIDIYQQKITNGTIKYLPSKGLMEAFRYDYLAERLLVLSKQIDSD